MLFTIYRKQIFILYDVIAFLFLFYFIVNLMRHRCFSAEVNNCC